MASKKGGKGSSGGGLTALKIGSRVRCTDDGVEGRIVWANAVSVKIRWNDGEQVTWRRDALAGRPIAILAAAPDEDEPATTAASQQPEAEPLLERTTTYRPASNCIVQQAIGLVRKPGRGASQRRGAARRPACFDDGQGRGRALVALGALTLR